MFKCVFKTKPTISYPPPRNRGRGNGKGKVFFLIIITIGYVQCCCGYYCRLTARRSWSQIPFGALGLLYLQLSFQCRRGSLQPPSTAQIRMWGRVELATDLSCKGWRLLALTVFVKPGVMHTTLLFHTARFGAFTGPACSSGRRTHEP